MKKSLLFLAILLVAGILVLPSTGSAQGGQGYGWSYCPYCGSQFGNQGGYGYGCGMGPGMGGGMMGGGMMGGGQGMMGRGQGMMGPGYGPQQQYRPMQKPLDAKEARALVEGNLQASRNPNLKVGSVKDAGNAFEVDILTKNNSPVDRVLVDKQTGMTRSAY